MQPLNVAIVGLGTVGSGVAKILREQPDRLARRCGRTILLKRAVVRNLGKPRALAMDAGLLTENVHDVIGDESIDVAVQLIGGVDPARQIMLSLLESGKHVVTANKALIYEHGEEIFRTARRHNRVVAFEASVCGGVPIIAALGTSLAANQVRSIEAILNGTSNFILTGMFGERRDYDDMVREAQAQGYAEADPALDVDGTDAAHKLVILSQLAFGTRIPISEFTVRGIDTLELADLLYADELGYAVKLLAVSKLVNGELEMHVQPTLIRKDRPLAGIGSVYNQVAIEADVVGKTWFSGQGAGQMPTASAVLADLIDVAVGRTALTFPRLDIWGDKPAIAIRPPNSVDARFYLRFNVEDRPHVFADIADILGRHNISLASIIQHEAPEIDEPDQPAEAMPTVPVVVMTHRSTQGQLLAAEQEFARLTTLRPPYVRMPVAD